MDDCAPFADLAGLAGWPADRAEQQLVAVLAQRGLRMGTAESLTGGLLAHRLSLVPGSGDVLAGGVVAYQREVKHRLLDVPAGPVVSAPAAEAMARAVARLLDVEVSVSLTGVAGPEPQDGQPVGRVYVGWRTPEGSGVVCVDLPGDHQAVCDRAASTAVRLLLGQLDGVALAH